MGQDSLQNAEGHSGTTYMRLSRATIGIAVITWDRAGSSTKGREKRAQWVAAQLEPAQDTPFWFGRLRLSRAYSTSQQQDTLPSSQRRRATPSVSGSRCRSCCAGFPARHWCGGASRTIRLRKRRDATVWWENPSGQHSLVPTQGGLSTFVSCSAQAGLGEH